MRVIPGTLARQSELPLGSPVNVRKSGAEGTGWGFGGGAPPFPHVRRGGMSRRQMERQSGFLVEIEDGVRNAAAAFRDNDVEASVTTAVRLWWTSRLRGRRFARLVYEARDVTQKRISLGIVGQGEPGRREAMPYFFAVLRDLVDQARRGLAQRSDRRRAE
jgi:hypothetical protein